MSQERVPVAVPKGSKSLAARDWCSSNLRLSQWHQSRNSYHGSFTHVIFEFYDPHYDPHLAAEFALRFC